MDMVIPTTATEVVFFLNHAKDYIVFAETDIEVQAKALLIIVQKMYRVMELDGLGDASLLHTINETRHVLQDVESR